MGLLGNLFGKKKQDEPPYPSWATDSAKFGTFALTLKEKVKQRGIPDKFLDGVMQDDYGRNKLLFMAGLMEQQGASFDEQVKAIIDHVGEYWSNMDEKESWYDN